MAVSQWYLKVTRRPKSAQGDDERTVLKQLLKKKKKSDFGTTFYTNREHLNSGTEWDSSVEKFDILSDNIDVDVSHSEFFSRRYV